MERYNINKCIKKNEVLDRILFRLSLFLVSNDAFDLLNQQNGGCKLLVNHIGFLYIHVVIYFIYLFICVSSSHT